MTFVVKYGAPLTAGQAVAADPREDRKGGGGGGNDGLNLDPPLMALLQKIPSKDKGWGASSRLRWFRTFAMNVSQVYDGDDDDLVELKIDMSEGSREKQR